MIPTTRTLSPLSLCLVVSGLACSPALTARKVKTQEELRFRGIDDEQVAVYSPNSKLFRLAVVDFVDQTHNTAGKVEDMFADVMTTALYRTSRFTLYDRSQLKRKNLTGRETQVLSEEKTAAKAETRSEDGADDKSKVQVKAKYTEEGSRQDDSQQAEKQMDKLSKEVDGIFIGFITNAEMVDGSARGTYTIDYRILKRVPAAQSADGFATLVIFADSAVVHFTGNPVQKDAKPVTLARADLESIAGQVANFFPKLDAPEYSAAKVTDVNGKTVTVNLGNKQVKPGYSFFIITAPDDQTGEFNYKGNFIIRDAFEKASRADLGVELDEKMMKSIKVGDRILMK